MHRYLLLIVSLVACAPVASPRAAAAGDPSPAVELRAAEEAFAATMAERDLDAFGSFIDDEAVFFSGSVELRGKRAVMSAWAEFFAGDSAPFSWRPEVVSVLDSGQLGLSSGPVFNPAGDRIGTFNSIWRRDGDGSWKIIFDRGCR